MVQELRPQSDTTNRPQLLKKQHDKAFRQLGLFYDSMNLGQLLREGLSTQGLTDTYQG